MKRTGGSGKEQPRRARRPCYKRMSKNSECVSFLNSWILSKRKDLHISAGPLKFAI